MKFTNSFTPIALALGMSLSMSAFAEKESNNSVNSANFMAGSSVDMPGSIDSKDIDIYQFHVNQGSAVSITVRGPIGSTLDTQVAVYDSQKNLVGQHDDVLSVNAMTRYSVLKLPTMAEGCYYMVVTSGGTQVSSGSDISMTAESARGTTLAGDYTAAVSGLSGAGADACAKPEGLTVEAQVRPGKDDHVRLNSLSRGAIEVAILSQDGFNPRTDVNQASLKFGANGDEESLRKCFNNARSSRDYNGDDVADLVCIFSNRKSGLTYDSETATLTGVTNGGEAFTAADIDLKVLKRNHDHKGRDQGKHKGSK